MSKNNNQNGINVLSLFDGMSCGQIALNNLGVKINHYYSSEIDKNCNKLVKERFPNTIQLGDITKLTEEQLKSLPKIDLLIGGSPCFEENTLIYTDVGYKKIKDIQVGDYVLTHKNRFKKVLKVGAKLSNTIKLKVQGTIDTITTLNHPYFSLKKEKKWNNKKRVYENVFSEEPEWKKVEELNKGHYLLQNINLKKENLLNITKEEAWIIGAYLADGHTRKDLRKEDGRRGRYYAVILSFGLDKAKKFEEQKIINGIKYNIYNHGPSVKRVVFCNKRLTEIVEEHCGCGAENKFISPVLLNLPKDILENLIDGYLFGDGSVKGNKIKCNSVSNTLLLGFSQAILKIYGKHVNFSFIKKEPFCYIQGRLVNQRDYYEVYFSKNKLEKEKPFLKKDFLCLPFKKIEPYKEIFVYNIEVEEDNSYTANNLIVHNCQGFSMAGKQLNFNDPRSKLFFDYVKVLEIVKPTYFLLENVVMKKEYEDIITQYLKVEPVLIDSALVSAQQRKRLYWANFKIEQPQEIEANLSDIIDLSLPLNNPLTKEVLLDLNQHEFKDSPKKLEDFFDVKNNLRCLNRANITGRRLDENGKRKDYNKSLPISQTLEVRNSNLEKSTCLTTVPKSNVLTCLPIGVYRDAFKRKLPFRYYSWQEMAKLQTVDPNYFLNSKNELIVPQTSIKHMLGNGWTVNVISHIFSFLPFLTKKS